MLFELMDPAQPEARQFLVFTFMQANNAPPLKACFEFGLYHEPPTEAQHRNLFYKAVVRMTCGNIYKASKACMYITGIQKLKLMP